MAATNELMIERAGQAGSVARRRANFAIFLGPAIVLTVLFFVIPVLIDIAVSFTDLSRSLRVTKFTTEQYAKIFQGDRRLPQVIGLTFVYVFGTLAIFNVTSGLILALPSRPGEFHPEPLTDPDLTLSRHPARATERRLPPPIENWSSSCCQLARSQRR